MALLATVVALGLSGAMFELCIQYLVLTADEGKQLTKRQNQVLWVALLVCGLLLSEVPWVAQFTHAVGWLLFAAVGALGLYSSFKNR